MAERRMFSRRVLKTDPFLEMPVSCRDLYYQLCMDADDDGFVSNPRMTMKLCGATADDLSLLLAKKFLISFDSGVVAIKHWRIHNELKKDRYKPTTHYKEKQTLLIQENGAYSLEEGDQLTLSLQVGNNLYSQNSIGKDSIGKVSKEEREIYNKGFELFWSIYPRKVGKADCRRWWDSRYFPADEVAKMIEKVKQYIHTKQWKAGFIPHPKTFLNQGRWEDEIPDEQLVEGEGGFKSYAKS